MGLDLTDPADLDWISEGRRRGGVESRFPVRYDDEEFSEDSRDRLTRAIRDTLLEIERDASPERAQKAAKSILDVLSDDAISESAVTAWEETHKRDLGGKAYLPVFYESWAKTLVREFRLRGDGSDSPNEGKRLQRA